MQHVTIYTTPLCGYCFAAKRLLKKKNVPFEEINVARSPDLRQEMMSKSGGRHTVPQIFVGKVHVGGFDDLAALEMDDKLDPLLNAD